MGIEKSSKSFFNGGQILIFRVRMNEFTAHILIRSAGIVLHCRQPVTLEMPMPSNFSWRMEQIPTLKVRTLLN
jgi:hypothetical protein